MNNVRYLDLDDEFRFESNRRNACCGNLGPSEKIALDPYDILRLSRNRKLSTGSFLGEYVEIVLENETHLPSAFLRLQARKGPGKCPFLRSNRCSVFTDRPLKCRLYPLLKVSNRENSHFALVEDHSRENGSPGPVWTVSQWLKTSGSFPYLNNRTALYAFFDNYHADTFKALPEKIKLDFGRRLYDLDSFASNINGAPDLPDEGELLRRLCDWAGEFLNRYGCLFAEKAPAAL